MSLGELDCVCTKQANRYSLLLSGSERIMVTSKPFANTDIR